MSGISHQLRSLLNRYNDRRLQDKSYSYNRLKEHTATRFLKLSAGVKDEPLVCGLITCSLAEAPSFDAISYTWGTTVEALRISCDGEELYITRNLCQALKQLRRADSDRIIWADQICINQNDQDERGQQVSLMGSIYAQADTVVACLGGTLEHSKELSNFLKALIRHVEKEVKSFGDWRLAAFRARCPDSFAEMAGLGILNSIFQHPFFERKWVIQELGLANEPVVLIGSSEISWSVLLECALYLKYDLKIRQRFPLPWATDVHCGTLSGWGAEIKRHWFVDGGQNHSFLAVLDQARPLLASDDRDRIYAFLGHPLSRMTDGSTVVEPTYTIDLKTCLYEFAKQWILKTGDLSILAAVDIREAEKDRGNPSWVPTWRSRNYQSLNMGTHRRFDAAAPLTDVAVVRNSWLRVPGVVLDTVESIHPIQIDHGKDPPSREYAKVMAAWSYIRNGRPVVTGGRSYTEAFVQTISTLDSPNFESIEWQRAFERKLGSLLHPDKQYKYNNWFELEGKSKEEETLPKYVHCIEEVNKGRVLMFSKERGIMGLVPETTREGDVCAIVAHCQVPLVLRPVSEALQHYELMGEAYLHGYMYGEVAEDIAAEQVHVSGLTIC